MIEYVAVDLRGLGEKCCIKIVSGDIWHHPGVIVVDNSTIIVD